MRRILCLHFPNWPIQRLCVAKPELDRRRPIILQARDARRGQLVAAANSVAQQRGVRQGLPLAEAAALVAAGGEGCFLPADPAADAAALARLAEHCERFSPLVGWETVADRPRALDALLLDVTGIGILFGGEEALLREVGRDLKRLGYHTKVAAAGTVGAAWALCQAGKDSGQAQPLDSLAISTLRLPEETVALLAHLGVTRIGQLRQLPRASLRARFGELLLLRLDQLLGTVAETIVPHRPLPELLAERILEYPAERQEAVAGIVQELVQRLAGQLAERRQGAVRLACRLDGTPPFMFQVGLFRPTADPLHLWDLLRLHLESVASPVSRATLTAPLTAPLENRQGELFATGQREAERHWALLVDRLTSRLGAEAVRRAELTADPLPERAVEYAPLTNAKSKRKPRAASATRPLRLRSLPLALEVISVVPDGPPVSFQFCGRTHTVVRWWGPERIESGWWRGPSQRRDYYRVESDLGQRYWLFRRLQDGGWYLHGEFA